MIIAEIVSEETRKKIQDVYIPEKARDIKYSAFLEFSFKANNIFEWIRNEEELGRKYDLQYLMKVCDTVASVLNVDVNILKNLKYKEQQWIWDAWYSIHNIIKDYKPNDNAGQFRHNGKWWKVPGITKSIIRNEVYLDSMTMQQVSEIGSIEKKLQDVLFTFNEREQKEAGYNKENDEIAQHFSYALMKIAICVSDPNEIPTDATFDKWLDERVIELQDITMVDALDTIFFLIGLPKDLGLLIDLDFTLKQYLYADSIKRMEQTTQQE